MDVFNFRNTIKCSDAIKQAEKYRNIKIQEEKEKIAKEKIRILKEQTQVIETMINKGNTLIQDLIESGGGKGATACTGLQFDVDVLDSSLEFVRKHFRDAGYKISLHYTNYDCNGFGTFNHRGEIEIQFQ